MPAFIMLAVLCLGINPGAELFVADEIQTLETSVTLENEKIQNNDFAIESEQFQYSGLSTQSCIRVQQSLPGKYYSLRFADIRGSPLLAS